jgi:MFS family permease
MNMDGKADDAGINIRALIFALLALACGHMLSTLLRTIPAISLDVMAADFRTAPQTLASLTSVYHFAFAASQIPVGAAMDRFGVRPVSLSLLAGTIVGALASGLATGPEGFLFGQFLLGVATSGMLMCPMTLAAKQMSAARFGLWSGIILSNAAVGEPAGLCRRILGVARGILDLRRFWRGGGDCGVPAGSETAGRARG